MVAIISLAAAVIISFASSVYRHGEGISVQREGVQCGTKTVSSRQGRLEPMRQKYHLPHVNRLCNMQCVPFVQMKVVVTIGPNDGATWVNVIVVDTPYMLTECAVVRTVNPRYASHVLDSVSREEVGVSEK